MVLLLDGVERVDCEGAVDKTDEEVLALWREARGGGLEVEVVVVDELVVVGIVDLEAVVFGEGGENLLDGVQGEEEFLVLLLVDVGELRGVVAQVDRVAEFELFLLSVELLRLLLVD